MFLLEVMIVRERVTVYMWLTHPFFYWWRHLILYNHLWVCAQVKILGLYYNVIIKIHLFQWFSVFLNWNLAFVLISKWGAFGTQGKNYPAYNTEDVLHEVFLAITSCLSTSTTVGINNVIHNKKIIQIVKLEMVHRKCSCIKGTPGWDLKWVTHGLMSYVLLI